MEEIFEKYITISQFAKMYNVNKKTLIYYDEIGLFKPAFVKENGYRYYTIHQGGLFEVILILKQLGMPLKSIKQYLEKRSVEELNIILLEQKNNIERQMQELNRINNIIKNKLDILQSYKSIELDKMVIENMEEEYFVLSKPIKHKSELFAAKILCEHVSKSYQTNLYSGFGFGAIIEDKQIINSDYLNYSYFYTKIDTKIKGVDYFIKPKGKYLVFYHKGHWLEFYKIYNIAKKYLKNQNLKISGYCYEEYLFDDATFKTPDEYITKFMIQIS